MATGSACGSRHGSGTHGGGGGRVGRGSGRISASGTASSPISATSSSARMPRRLAATATVVRGDRFAEEVARLEQGQSGPASGEWQSCGGVGGQAAQVGGHAQLLDHDGLRRCPRRRPRHRVDGRAHRAEHARPVRVALRDQGQPVVRRDEPVVLADDDRYSMLSTTTGGPRSRPASGASYGSR